MSRHAEPPARPPDETAGPAPEPTDDRRRNETWTDEAAGPLVRPYTMTGGRTHPSGDGFDLVAYILAVEAAQPEAGLGPEHFDVLEACRQPTSVAELASKLDLPVGVVRVLLGDLQEKDLILVREPASDLQLPDTQLLEAVIHGLQAL